MLAADTLPILSTLKYSWSAESPALPARLRIIVLLAWCGTISSMLSSSVRPDPSRSSGSGCRFELAEHLHQVPLDQRLHLRTVHGDVAVELRVRPDDRVDLAVRPARVGLHHLHVPGLAVGGRSDDHRRRPVPEDHPRGADAADLVRELLHADQQDGPPDLLELADGLAHPVRQPGAGRHHVDRGVRLQQAELAGQPARDRRDLPVAGARADQHRTDFRGERPDLASAARAACSASSSGSRLV